MIREGRAGDVDRCVQLARLAAPERGNSEWRQALRRDLESAVHLLVVAEAEGGIVGYGRDRLFAQGPDAPADSAPSGYYPPGIFVGPGQRGKGIGTDLTRMRPGW